MNPIFQEMLETTLSILKPSARDMERGLKSHANSLVVDTSSFAPPACSRAKELQQRKRRQRIMRLNS